MLDLYEVTQNIVSESKKVGYNPETDTNWCHLPMEMRAECVKWLDFKTRTRLGATSKTEKSLVDLRKYHFESLTIHYDLKDDEWVIRGEKKMEDGSRHIEYCTDWSKTNEKHLKCISEILKKSVIESFAFSLDDELGFAEPPLLPELAKYAPFRFKRINVFFGHTAVFFLSNCANLDRINLYGSTLSQFPVAEVLNLPSVLNVKEFRINQMKDVDFSVLLPGLVQKWIDKDAEVGKLLQSAVEFEGAVELIASKFADRIIDKTEKEVRIRMDNPKKQILMRCIGSEDGYEYITCKVIPMELPKSEYGIGDEWVKWEYNESQGKVHGDNPHEDSWC